MKKGNPEIIPEKIQIVSINIIKANLDTTDEFLENQIKPDFFKFGLAQEIAYNFEESRSRCRLFLTLEACDSDDKPIGLKVEYGIEFHFHVDNLQEFVIETADGEPQLEASIGATLLGMAYSTARGIVFERTRGTLFSGVLLPVIDPFKALMDNDKNG